MRNLEVRTVNPAWVCTCSVCNMDYRTTGNSYYDTTDGLLVCNDCAEGGVQMVANYWRTPVYAVDNAHYVGVSDKRDIVVFDGAEEVRISQRSILNHKRLAGVLYAIQLMLKQGNGVGIASESFLAKKLYAVLEEEENAETV